MVRREIAEFRRKQTERQIREQLSTGLTGLASSRELIATARAVRTATVNPAQPPNVDAVEAGLHNKMQAEIDNEPATAKASTNLKKQTHPATQSAAPTPIPGRNAPCPCHSGQKYKLCCGHWSKTKAA